jgi:hypothetical protein
MKKTDPEGIRKLASQVVVTLMSPQDKVAVIEFDSDARVLTGWKAASDRDAIFDAIVRVGNTGGFTDFRSGLEKAEELFDEAPEKADKIILLLSDGKLEPNPRAEAYAPYHLRYLPVLGKSRPERVRIYESEFLAPLSLKARRLIESEILPSFKKDGIEIYAVGLSPFADKKFLDYLADETSRTKTESHSFYASHATDLMDAFTGLLHFWENKIVVYTDSGKITPNLHRSIPFDEFLRDVSFIVLSEKEADFSVRSAKGNEMGVQVKETHPELKILHTPKPRGQWDYGFSGGTGEFRLLVVGQSTIDMEIEGLKEKYGYGEDLRAVVRLTYGEGDARPLLSDRSRVEVEIGSDLSEGSQSYLKENLKEGKEGFLLEHTFSQTGSTMIRFTLHAFDRQGKELLPRPSKQFKVEVLPRFYAEPDFIDFGNVETGKKVEASVRVHSGLESEVQVHVQGAIEKAGRCTGESSRLPVIEGIRFSIAPGQSYEHALILSVPEDGCWGDFEGTINFISDKGDTYKIGFRTHIPSIWEKLTYAAIFLIFIIAVALAVLAILWGNLKSPVGVLRPVSYPPSAPAMSDIKLSRVKRGIWSRWLHWRKNIIKVGSARSDIRLAALPPKMEIAFVFHRFGGDYVKNLSPKESGHTLIVRHPDVQINIERGPGSQYQLAHGLNITINDYEFIYENIK